MLVDVIGGFVRVHTEVPVASDLKVGRKLPMEDGDALTDVTRAVAVRVTANDAANHDYAEHNSQDRHQGGIVGTVDLGSHQQHVRSTL